MKIHTLFRKQFLPVDIFQAWAFFSSPKNLRTITPPQMNFKILDISGGSKMYSGQIIKYKVNILPLISTNWVTEITHVDEPNCFVDEQRTGPYALWHHQHHFKEIDDGIEMTDVVNYAIPYGVVGQLANTLFVSREVNRIFDFRSKVLQNMFSANENIKLAKNTNP